MVTSATTVASPNQVFDITPVAWTYSKEINNDQVAVMDWMMQQCSLGSADTPDAIAAHTQYFMYLPSKYAPLTLNPCGFTP